MRILLGMLILLYNVLLLDDFLLYFHLLFDQIVLNESSLKLGVRFHRIGGNDGLEVNQLLEGFVARGAIAIHVKELVW